MVLHSRVSCQPQSWKLNLFNYLCPPLALVFDYKVLVNSLNCAMGDESVSTLPLGSFVEAGWCQENPLAVISFGAILGFMKHIVQSVLNKFGYRIVRIDICADTGHAQGLDPFFTLLKQCNFAPRHIIDVGANKGIWTRVAIKHFPAAHYTLLEPQDHLKENIQDLIDRGFRINW